MDSIFSNIYKYRQRENRNAKENFLTEIFAFCLRNDSLFFKYFLEKLGFELSDKSYSVETQIYYNNGKDIPDLEIKWNGDNHLLIEAKVAQEEGTNQLERYRNILINSNIDKKHLVFLTKNYEAKTIDSLEGWNETGTHKALSQNFINIENNEKSLSFQHLRWTDIFNLITNENTEITKQLKQYLKDENMDTINFTFSDIVALQQVENVFPKMNKILDEIAPYFKATIGEDAQHKGEQVTKRLSNNNCYRDYKWFGHFCINYGIGWFSEDEVFVFLDFYMRDFDDKENLAEKIKNEIKELNYLYKNDYDLSIGFKKSLASFLDEKYHHEAITKQLKEWIDKVKVFKDKNPELF